MSKWTPGPWELVKVKGRPQPMITVCAGPQPVCDMYRGYDKPDWTIEADAALVAAAPDLAEALENLVNEIVEYNPTNINITAARAALDKAKGER